MSEIRSTRARNIVLGAFSLVLSLGASYLSYEMATKDTGIDVQASNIETVNAINECIRLGESRGFNSLREPDGVVFHKTRSELSGSYSELFSMQATASYCKNVEIIEACMGEDCSSDYADSSKPYHDAFFRFKISLPEVSL